MSIELGSQLDLRPQPWRLWRDTVATAIRRSVFRRRRQLQELRDELTELHGTVHRLMAITEDVLDALAQDDVVGD
jgi:hypothetical protein